ncbi:MAG TPA: hypothetical protein VFF06_16155 [Polyangia bacterium]|nr:hypothetical protein [Polyangia bacterium]
MVALSLCSACGGGLPECMAPSSCLARAHTQVSGASLVADQGQLFWLTNDGGVYRMPVMGGDVVELVPPSDGRETCADAIALSSDSIYFARTATIWRVPRTGGAAAQIVGTDTPRECNTAIVVDSGFLYWVSAKAIFSQPLDGGAVATLADVTKQYRPEIRMANGRVYWGVDSLTPFGTSDDLAGNLGVWSVPVSGGPATRIIANDGSRMIAVDGDHIYFGADGGIHAAGVDGGGDQLLLTGGGLWTQKDDRHFYWADQSRSGLEPSIVAATVSSGAITTLIRDGFFDSMTEDDSALYYSRVGSSVGDVIVRLPKPVD